MRIRAYANTMKVVDEGWEIPDLNLDGQRERDLHSIVKSQIQSMIA